MKAPPTFQLALFVAEIVKDTSVLVLGKDITNVERSIDPDAYRIRCNKRFVLWAEDQSGFGEGVQKVLDLGRVEPQLEKLAGHANDRGRDMISVPVLGSGKECPIRFIFMAHKGLHPPELSPNTEERAKIDRGNALGNHRN